MKKKLLAGIIGLLLVSSCVGCGLEPVQVNVLNSDSLSSNQFGTFLDIGDSLVYDKATRIVYMENYTYCGFNVYTPYYAPNGFPYRYNPETNMFEEIVSQLPIP